MRKRQLDFVSPSLKLHNRYFHKLCNNAIVEISIKCLGHFTSFTNSAFIMRVSRTCFVSYKARNIFFYPPFSRLLPWLVFWLLPLHYQILRLELHHVVSIILKALLINDKTPLIKIWYIVYLGSRIFTHLTTIADPW